LQVAPSTVGLDLVAVTIDTSVAVRGSVAVIELLPTAVPTTGPAPGALALLERLADAVARCIDLPAVQAIVITGQGRDLAGQAGTATAAMDTIDATAYALAGQAALAVIADSLRPVIAAMAGPWLDEWLEIALACDLRVASAEATVGLTGVAHGTGSGFGGLTRMARLVGPGRAKWIALGGQTAVASEARELGLVDCVAAPGEALETALIVARRIAAASPQAVAAAKTAIDDGASVMLLPEALRSEAAAYGLLAADTAAGAWRRARAKELGTLVI